MPAYELEVTSDWESLAFWSFFDTADDQCPLWELGKARQEKRVYEDYEGKDPTWCPTGIQKFSHIFGAEDSSLSARLAKPQMPQVPGNAWFWWLIQYAGGTRRRQIPGCTMLCAALLWRSSTTQKWSVAALHWLLQAGPRGNKILGVFDFLSQTRAMFLFMFIHT